LKKTKKDVHKIKNTKTMTCTKCNFQNDAAANFCENCGAGLTLATAQPKVTKKKKQAIWVSLVRRFILIVAGFYLVAGIWKYFSDDRQATPESTAHAYTEAVLQENTAVVRQLATDEYAAKLATRTRNTAVMNKLSAMEIKTEQLSNIATGGRITVYVRFLDQYGRIEKQYRVQLESAFDPKWKVSGDNFDF
jgi:hypothetical protein